MKSHWKSPELMFYPVGKNSEKRYGGGGVWGWRLEEGRIAPFPVRLRVDIPLKMAMSWSCMTLFTARQCFSENGLEINSVTWSLKSALCIYYVLWNLPTSPVLSLSELRLSEFRSSVKIISAAKGIGNFHDKRPQFYNAHGVKVALILLITGAQPKFGTGHKMQRVSVFSKLHC